MHMLIYNDPRGEAYYKLIDYMMARAETFSLKGPRIPHTKQPDDPPMPDWAVMEPIKTYFVREEVYRYEGGCEDEHGVYVDESYDDLYWHYRCCPETGEFLKKTTDHLYGWIHRWTPGSGLPEDLNFYDAQGAWMMGGTSHEDIAYMRVSPEEAEWLYQEISGLFLIDPSPFRDPIRMLELTLHHRHDRLELMGPGSLEALSRIDKLPWLRSLEVHDEEIRTLPKPLFAVEHLRHLTLSTRDLGPIPAEIAKLGNLRSLELSNAPLLPEGGMHSHKSTANPKDWKLLPKEQLALTSLPPEIGRMKRLRSLSLTYTGLRELPDELAGLRNLRYLDLSDNLLEDEQPELLKRLKKLESVDTARDSGRYSGPFSRHYYE